MPWVADLNLVRNGNAIGVTIPRAFLHQLGWVSGRRVICELTDDLQSVIVRLPQPSDFGPIGPPRVRRVEREPQP